MRRLPSTLIAALLYGNALAQTAPGPAVDRNSYERSLQQLAHICMVGICLGDTLFSVDAQGQLLGKRPDPGVACPEQPSTTLLRRDDGSLVVVKFDRVAPSTVADSGYRVVAVAVDLGVSTRIEQQAALQTMLKRAGPMRPGKNAAGIEIWVRQVTPAIAVTVTLLNSSRDAEHVRPNDSIRLAAYYDHKERWLLSRPECTAGAPKL